MQGPSAAVACDWTARPGQAELHAATSKRHAAAAAAAARTPNAMRAVLTVALCATLANCAVVQDPRLHWCGPALHAWLSAQGGVVSDSTRVRVTDAGLGVHAARTLHPGALLASVPMSAVISEATLLAHARGPDLLALFAGSHPYSKVWTVVRGRRLVARAHSPTHARVDRGVCPVFAARAQGSRLPLCSVSAMPALGCARPPSGACARDRAAVRLTTLPPCSFGATLTSSGCRAARRWPP